MQLWLQLLAWLLLLMTSSLRTASHALEVIAPYESEVVVARSHAQGFRVRVDLGVDVRVPEHGLLALYLDDVRILLACPGNVTSAADCPTQGAPMSGEISLQVGNMESGEHVLSAELLDASLSPLAIVRRVFTYMEDSEEDDVLSGSCIVCAVSFCRPFSAFQSQQHGNGMFGAWHIRLTYAKRIQMDQRSI